MAKNGAGFAGFATRLDMDPTQGDLLALPDPATLTALPWKPEVGWVACDLVHEGADLKQGPRNILRSLLKSIEDEFQLHLKTGVECEFFVLEKSPLSLADKMDVSPKPCYDSMALMRRYEYVSRLSEYMEGLGWEVYQADHEDANGQFEINWGFGDALLTADRVVFFKYMARSVAEEMGMRVSFMPKPFADLSGSGCHAHLSLHDSSTGKNVMMDGDAHSPRAVDFLGGLTRHAPALCALTNPTVNSYKRLNARATASGATWSPTAVTWGGNNRTLLVRMPSGAPRFELRLGDMSANPYLMAAAVAAATLDGLRHKHKPPPRTDLNMFDSGDPDVRAVLDAAAPLPADLREAVDNLQTADTSLKDALGNDFIKSFTKLQRAHWAEYTSHLSEWEVRTYLDC